MNKEQIQKQIARETANLLEEYLPVSVDVEQIILSAIRRACETQKQPQHDEPTTQEVIEIDESSGKVANVSTEPNPQRSEQQECNCDNLEGKHAPSCPMNQVKTEVSEQQEWTIRAWVNGKGETTSSYDIWDGENQVVCDIEKDEAEQITTAHNTALAAAYKRGGDFARKCCVEEENEDLLRLERQLAADRQRRPAVTVEMFAEERRLHGITRQSLEDTRDLVQKLHEQLLSAQSAIEKKNKALIHLVTCLESSGFKIWKHDLDAITAEPELSLLHRHDAEVATTAVNNFITHTHNPIVAQLNKEIAEVRKPLVDALESALNVGEIRFGTCVLARDVKAKIEDVLAKVKKNS